VCCARRARGTRNCGTEFAIASTPVSAEQPDAKAFRIRSVPIVSVAGGSACGSGTAGCGRTKPTTITRNIAMMKAIVGTANTRADSATPHMFTPVISASTSRHSHTRAPYRAGNAAVSASTPADTPTAALRT